MKSGIISISHSYNKEFLRLLEYHGIQPGSELPMWGIGNKNFSYYACTGFPDQINLYRFHRLSRGGLGCDPTYPDIVDSTQTLHLPYKFHIYNPWEIPQFIEDDYDDCIRQMVEYYSTTYDHISILWSGGVDSSAVVAGFIKYGDIKKISIGHTKGSIIEFPEFFQYLQNNNFHLIDLEQNELSSLPGMIVHGGGPGAVGGDVTAIYSNLGQLNKPWHESIKKEDWGDIYNSLYEFTENYLKLYGKDIPTIADLCIFVNMINNTTIGSMYLHYDKNLKFENISTFFDNKIFKRWNYFHAAQYVIDSHEPKKYKLPAKKIVFDVIKDENYLLNKGKVDSRDLWIKKCNTGTDPANWSKIHHGYFFIDSSNERVSANSKEEYIEKYQGKFDSYFNQPLI